MSKFVLGLLTILIFYPASAFALDNHPRVVVAIVLNDWPKRYSIERETGEPTGFAIDVMREVAERSGIAIQYIIAQNWSEADEMAEQFETIIFPNMGISDERLNTYDFTTPYETSSLGIFFRRTTPCIDSLKGLSGKKVGALETNLGIDFIKEKTDADLQLYISLEEMLMALLSGEVHAIIYPSEHVLNMARRSGLEEKIKQCLGPLREVMRAIAVKKGNTLLHERLEAALQHLMKTDGFKRIYERWYSKPVPFWNARRFSILMLIFTGSIVLVGLFWRHRLILKSNKIKSEMIRRLKEAEKAKARSEILHRNLINTIPDLIWLKDENGVYLSCNPTFERFFGAKESEIIGKTDYDFVDKHLADFFRRHDNAALKSGKPSVNEETLTFASDGYSGIFETIKAPMYDKEGNLIGIIGISRDITERKKVEYGLKKSEKRLKSAQRIGRLGNWEYDISKDMFWCSEQAKLIYGLDPAHDTFTVDEIENRIPERKRVHQALLDLIENEKPYDIEFEINTANGAPSVKTIKSTAELLLDEGGMPIKVIGVIQDITEQKKAEIEKIEMAKQLRQSQKMEAIGNLAGGIAHDFNNILAAILGYCELALYETEDGTEIQNDLKEIHAAGHRAKDLVKQILTFSRQSEDEIIPVQVNSIMKEIVSLLKASIPSSIEIETFIESRSFINGNPTQIHQVILNLCTNAAYSMEKDGGVLMLSLKDVGVEEPSDMGIPYKLAPGNYVEIMVSDTGEGIPSDIIDSIFDPYFTTKPRGEGTGMGLALVHGIVESYGGTITVSSEVGKGSVFKLLFPIIEVRRSNSNDKFGELPKGSGRILFVDDEKPIVKMVGRTLGHLGYSVVTRTSSVDALDTFRAGPEKFDLVITDMTMPKLPGDKLAMEMLEIRPDLPVIICTGHSKNISEKQAIKIGIKAFLNKPIDTADLAKTVRAVLDKHARFR